MVGVIIHGNFSFTDWSSELSVVHEDFATFIDFACVIEFFKSPPDRFHKVFIHSAIGVVKIYPATNAVDSRVPGFGIGHHGFASLGNIFFKTPFGANIAAIGNTKLFFNKIFSRETMAIPPPSAFHTITIHGPKARDCILDDAREERTMMRIAGNKRWTIIKNIRFVFWAIFNRLFKDFVFFPPLGDGFFVFYSFSSLTSLIFHFGSFILKNPMVLPLELSWSGTIQLPSFDARRLI